jgi:hypothetical protein
VGRKRDTSGEEVYTYVYGMLGFPRGRGARLQRYLASMLGATITVVEGVAAAAASRRARSLESSCALREPDAEGLGAALHSPPIDITHHFPAHSVERVTGWYMVTVAAADNVAKRKLNGCHDTLISGVRVCVKHRQTRTLDEPLMNHHARFRLALSNPSGGSDPVGSPRRVCLPFQDAGGGRDEKAVARRDRVYLSTPVAHSVAYSAISATLWIR